MLHRNVGGIGKSILDADAVSVKSWKFWMLHLPLKLWEHSRLKIVLKWRRPSNSYSEENTKWVHVWLVHRKDKRISVFRPTGHSFYGNAGISFVIDIAWHFDIVTLWHCDKHSMTLPWCTNLSVARSSLLRLENPKGLFWRISDWLVCLTWVKLLIILICWCNFKPLHIVEIQKVGDTGDISLFFF